MKVTLDHNCIIHLVNATPIGQLLHSTINASGHTFFIADIGASEMRQRGVTPENYNLFEDLLAEAGLVKLGRLTPMGIWNVTFWDYALSATNEDSVLADRIEEILFPYHASEPVPPDLDQPGARKWLNRVCDVQTMWCHIHYKNDVFLTTDKNFTKVSKLSRLLGIGAGRICSPSDL